MSDVDKKVDGALNDVMTSVGGHVADLGKTAFDALEDLLKQADKAMPDEEGLKDIARGFGVDFGGEKKPGGK